MTTQGAGHFPLGLESERQVDGLRLAIGYRANTILAIKTEGEGLDPLQCWHGLDRQKSQPDESGTPHPKPSKPGSYLSKIIRKSVPPSLPLQCCSTCELLMVTDRADPFEMIHHSRRIGTRHIAERYLQNAAPDVPTRLDPPTNCAAILTYWQPGRLRLYS